MPNLDDDLNKEVSPAHTGMNYNTYGIYGELYNPDSILKAKGGDLDIYEVVMRDDQFKSTFTQRISRITSREWFVEPGGESAKDKAAADHIEEVFRAINFDEITKRMLFGLFYGYAVAEVMYKVEAGKIAIDDIKVRDRSRFEFHKDGGLLLIPDTMTALRVPMPDKKFWIYSVGADHSDNPYGKGLAHWLYWPVFFKRGGMQSWLKFLDKYGAPTAKGIFPRSATDAEKTKLLEALRAISTDAGVIVPEGMDIQLIEAARGGTASYAELYDRMNSAISKVVLTQTLTTEQGTTGARAMASVHDDIAWLVAKDDADSLCQSLNSSVVTWLTEWNFSGAIAPKVWRKMEVEPSKAENAAIDKQLYDIGYKSTPERIKLIYGEGYEPIQAAPAIIQPADNAASFAESDIIGARLNEARQAQDDMETAAQNLSKANASILKRRIDSILAMLDETGDLKSFAEQLTELGKDGGDPDAELIKALEQSAFAAKLYATKVVKP